MGRSVGVFLALLAVLASAGCSSGPGLSVAGLEEASAANPVSVSGSTSTSVESADVTSSTVLSTPTTVVPATSSTALPLTTTTPPATTVPAIDPEVVARSQIPQDVELVFGRSIEGRALTVERRGDPAGVRVLVVGCIHGNEAAGEAIVQRLSAIDVPSGVELWLVLTINPDGTAAGIRHNAAGVDLNRNFPVNWAPLAELGDWQYGGPAAASEPETSAMVALGELVEPALVLWYHQDLNRISPSRGLSGLVRERYAELTGLPLIEVTGGTYTGTASQWSRAVSADGGVGFTVELGPTLSDEEADAHALAVVTVASELLAS